MVIATMIISTVSIITAAACVGIVLKEKANNKRSRNVMLDYVNHSCSAISESCYEYADKVCDENFAHFTSAMFDMEKAVKELSARVANLESGVIPDYENATAAVKAVNDFSAGITNIMGFNPIKAELARRQIEGEQE